MYEFPDNKLSQIPTISSSFPDLKSIREAALAQLDSQDKGWLFKKLLLRESWILTLHAHQAAQLKTT